MNRQKFWPFLGICFFATAAHAGTSTLKLGNSQYVSSGTPFFRSDASDQNSSISLQIERDLKFKKSLGAKVAVKNEFSATENWNYVNVYQAYGRARLPVGATLEVGRKLDTWSSAEDEWKQGVFQPRYLQNKLRPEAAGLTGVFFGSSYRSTLWTVGILPAHIPDLGARFWVADHKLVSKNPWFDPPASQFRIAGEPSEIHYSVDKPDVVDIVGHPGAVAKVEISRAEFGGRLAAAFKPMAQLRLGFPATRGVIVGDNDDYLNVRITPRVQYHTVLSADVWTTASGWQMTAGLTYDQPNPETYNADWMNQVFGPAWIWSFLAVRSLEDDGPNSLRLKLGLLKIDGGRSPDSGIYAGTKSLFEGRFQYSEAYMAGLLWPVRGMLRRPLDVEGRVVFDRLQNGGWVRLAAGYNLTRDLRIDGEADLLGLLGPDAQERDGFFSSYRANDRVGLGMSYVY